MATCGAYRQIKVPTGLQASLVSQVPAKYFKSHASNLAPPTSSAPLRSIQFMDVPPHLLILLITQLSSHLCCSPLWLSSLCSLYSLTLVISLLSQMTLAVSSLLALSSLFLSLSALKSSKCLWLFFLISIKTFP